LIDSLLVFSLYGTSSLGITEQHSTRLWHMFGLEPDLKTDFQSLWAHPPYNVGPRSAYFRVILRQHRDVREYLWSATRNRKRLVNYERSSAEWAKKVSCCIGGCNFVNYGPI